MGVYIGLLSIILISDNDETDQDSVLDESNSLLTYRGVSQK